MSYESKKDEMVGTYVSEFQRELALAKHFKEVTQRPPMPYGYPIAVYRPTHICKSPAKRKFLFKAMRGCQSNGVPLVLRMESGGNYILGIYNPHPLY